ncbi:hypothetical protein AVEN_242613-1 [Araneus ventricosus]|uniref:Uncharacterized protein n=1 Tax=Araneus ventricosus TaxID=182803 RepID=A0A4Y2K8K4_ARAVE|nr:hypothetical protein AVEN_242613-1 [Araneus ventricosus]
MSESQSYRCMISESREGKKQIIAVASIHGGHLKAKAESSELWDFVFRRKCRRLNQVLMNRRRISTEFVERNYPRRKQYKDTYTDKATQIALAHWNQTQLLVTFCRL